MPTHTWEISRTTYKVSDFVSWQRASSLILTPKFQRRPVWKKGAKSYLVDTVIRGLPMPIIFLREQPTDLKLIEPRREVVDGQQRIRTLLAYIDPKLLPDFELNRDDFKVSRTHNLELAGKGFDHLAADLRQRILDYQFSVHVLPSNVDDREVVQLFARMNSTGVQLNPQELRNAEWFGEFKTSMYEIAAEQLQRWRDWRVFSENDIARMEEVELVSEFALLALKDILGKTKKAIDTLYEEKDDTFPERDEIERRFRHIMDVIDTNFGKQMPFIAFRKKTLFFSLYAFAYDKVYTIKSPLRRARPRPLDPEDSDWVLEAGKHITKGAAPRQVMDATERRTTHPSSRQRILKYLTDRK